MYVFVLHDNNQGIGLMAVICRTAGCKYFSGT
jgi:hypothetical protein